jgi:twinfilin
MARANLNIHPSIAESFFAAQDSRSIRLLLVKIENEDLILERAIEKVNNVDSDFQNLLPQHLHDDQALFAIFCIDDEPIGALSWVLVAWIPDGCCVRDKMLYSSSREDLKRNLGLGYFKSDYAANSSADLMWNVYLESQKKETSTDILTENERLILEERTLSQAESNASKSTALGVIPFQLSSGALEALTEFQNGNKNWIEMTIDGEIVALVRAESVTESTNLRSVVSNEIATFIAAKLTSSTNEIITFFIFSCPEEVPIRMKMTMSSSKASVLAAAREQGIQFDK